MDVPEKDFPQVVADSDQVIRARLAACRCAQEVRAFGDDFER